MRRWIGVSVAAVAIGAGALPLHAQSASQRPTLAQARAAAGEGRVDEAWQILDRLPITRDAVALGVELALPGTSAQVPDARASWLADRGARLSIESADTTNRLTACVIVTRLSGDPVCAAEVLEWSSGVTAKPMHERVRFWRVQRLLGTNVALPPAGWETAVTGAAALELAAWPDLPAPSRVRLLEPLLASTDVGNQIAALHVLQLVPGSEALAVWRRLAADASLTFPGARTLITVGLARHGEKDALSTLAPHEAQLSAGDRFALALGRMERKDPAGRAALITMAQSAPETEAIRAVEALATLGPEPRLDARVRAAARDSELALRARWLAAAGQLRLGRTREVATQLTADDEGVRLAAALALAQAAVTPPAGRRPGA